MKNEMDTDRLSLTSIVFAMVNEKCSFQKIKREKYLDITFSVFRNWIRSKHGTEN